MNADNGEKLMLAARVRKLERENSWIKRIGLGAAALLVIDMLVLHHGIHGIVTAQQFVVKDSSGRTRAELTVSPEGPELNLYAASGERRSQLLGGPEDASLNLYIPVTASKPHAASLNLLMERTLMSSLSLDGDETALDMHSATGTGTARLAAEAKKAHFALSGAGQDGPGVSIEADAVRSCAAVSSATKPTALGALCIESVGLPALVMTDLNGDRATLGVAYPLNPATGRPTATSAASLVLERNKGHAVWSAPR